MRAAFQGEPGAYSEMALKQDFDVKTIACKTFDDVFDAVEKDADIGIVPIENSLAGSVAEVYDLLLERKVNIVAETYLKIQHCLIAKKGVRFQDIRRVYSHPQALAQCKDYIKKHGLASKPDYDTAGAAKDVLERGQGDEAAIASSLAAEQNGMIILEKDIASRRTNLTRFLIISKYDELKKGDNYKTSLVFEVAHKPGSLYSCLNAFAEQDVNLTKLESRPNLDKAFSYRFYLDFEGTPQDENIARALKEFQKHVQMIRILGSYPCGKMQTSPSRS